MKLFVPVLAALLVSTVAGNTVEVGADAEIEPRDEEVVETPECKQHAVFFSHGFHGAPRGLSSLVNLLSYQQGASRCPLLLHNCQANAGTYPWDRLTATSDGIAAGGTRVAHEILDFLLSHPDVTHISLVGLSLGGAYMRFAAGLLLPLQVASPPAQPAIDAFQAAAHKRRVHFSTFLAIASPSTGVRGHLSPVMDWGAQAGLGGQTGRDMLLEGLPSDWHHTHEGPLAGVQAMLAANGSASSPQAAAVWRAARRATAPTLLSMAAIGSDWWRALAAFSHRLLVGNEVGDSMVPFAASALAPHPSWHEQRGHPLKASSGAGAPGDNLAAEWTQAPVDTRDPEAVWSTYEAWLEAAGSSPPSPEDVIAAQLRAMGGWTTLQVRWADAWGSVLNHNRVTCPPFISLFAQCMPWLHQLVTRLLARL